jgi:hypothetical protein
MSTDPLSQLHKGKCHGQVSLNKYMIKMGMSIFKKLGIKYKMYKNAFLFMVIELSRECSHLISRYGVFVWVHCGSFGRCLLVTLLYQRECLVVVSQFE